MASVDQALSGDLTEIFEVSVALFLTVGGLRNGDVPEEAVLARSGLKAGSGEVLCDRIDDDDGRDIACAGMAEPQL